MKIKNVEELANVLGMAFRTYSATVATGRNIEPFLPLIDGQDGVTVFIMLSNSGEISIRAPAVEPISIKTVTAEPHVVVESPVVEDENVEITPVLEAEDPPSQYKDDDSTERTITETSPFTKDEEELVEKPKRKRRS